MNNPDRRNFVMPRKHQSAAPPIPRADELALQERFLAERGATRLPPTNDPAIIDLPPLVFDQSTKKWTRRAEVRTRTQWTKGKVT